MASKLTRLTHKIAIQLHLMAEIRTICSSRARRPVRKLMDTPSYVCVRLYAYSESSTPPPPPFSSSYRCPVLPISGILHVCFQNIIGIRRSSLFPFYSLLQRPDAAMGTLYTPQCTHYHLYVDTAVEVSGRYSDFVRNEKFKWSQHSNRNF
jgi:hypothetical protein